jgi:hypothetical protein
MFTALERVGTGKSIVASVPVGPAPRFTNLRLVGLVCGVSRKEYAHAHYLQHKPAVIARTKKFRSTAEGRAIEAAWQQKRRRANPLKRMVQEAKTRATKKGLAFDLTPSDLVIPATCPVLGIPLRRGTKPREDATPSIERIDPARGYVRGNVIVVSWRANRIKSDATLAELERIVEFYRKAMAS